jgi:hypothetical protein
MDHSLKPHMLVRQVLLCGIIMEILWQLLLSTSQISLRLMLRSLEIVDACSGADELWGDASAIFVDCMNLAAGIGKVVFKHCRREANEVAHLLARNSH